MNGRNRKQRQQLGWTICQSVQMCWWLSGWGNRDQLSQTDDFGQIYLIYPEWVSGGSSVTLLLAWWSWNKTTVEQFCVSWIGFLHVVCLHQMFFCKQQIPSHGQKPQADRSERDEEEGSGLKYTELHSGCWQKAAALSQTSKTCLRLNPNPNELMDKTGARTRMGNCFGYGAHRRPTDITSHVESPAIVWFLSAQFDC